MKNEQRVEGLDDFGSSIAKMLLYILLFYVVLTVSCVFVGRAFVGESNLMIFGQGITIASLVTLMVWKVNHKSLKIMEK